MGDVVWALLGAMAIGVSLGGFGSGGSILTVPVLVYLLRHEEKAAIAESLGIVGSIALIGAVQYAIAKMVSWRTFVLFAVPGMVGTVGGAWAASFVSGTVQLVVFGIVMLAASVMMWRRARGGGKRREDEGTGQRGAPAWWLVGLEGAGVGAMTGFVGVGGGFLIVPALVLLARLEMRRAVATSLAVIVANAAVGFVKYQSVLGELGQSVDWGTMGVFIVVGSLGSVVGKYVSQRVNQRALQKGFAGFLLLMAVFILVREGGALAG